MYLGEVCSALETVPVSFNNRSDVELTKCHKVEIAIRFKASLD